MNPASSRSISINSVPGYRFFMLGISTNCLMDRPLVAALDELAPLTGLIEVMAEGNHLITDTDLFSNYTQKFVIHAPFHGINVASVFEPIREASARVMISCLETASLIGAPVVMHPGYYAWEQERELSDRQFNRTLQKLRAASEEYGGEILFENMGNMNYFNLRTPADLPLISGAGLALDTGHANLNHCLPAFLKTRFRHMHIHDNHGSADTHSAVGEGDIDFARVLRALSSRHATAVIEVRSFAGVKSSMRALDGMNRKR